MVQRRLLDVAVEEFGLHGPDGASTRTIAAKAGTAMSSITYHYGGKAGLYLAAADHIAQQMAAMVEPALDLDVTATVDDPERARAAIHRLMGTILDHMMAETQASWALFISREQALPTEAFDRLYGGAMGRMFEHMAALVGTVAAPLDPVEARITTLTLMAQVFFIRTARAACTRLLDRPRLDAEAMARITARIRANTDAILDRLIAEQQEPQ